jgi:glycosyltransferase involved in cell wall biosynthesis
MQKRRSRRVLLALESSGPGGAEQMVLRLAAALREAGDQPVVASMRPGWMTERAAAAGFPVWILPQRPGLDPAWLGRLARRLRREAIDVVHAHEFGMNIYAGGAARLLRIPTVATIHGKRWLEKRRRVLAYRLIRRAGARLVAVSSDLADYLAVELRLPRSAIEVVHNGVPVPPTFSREERMRLRARARDALGIPADGPLLVAVGNLYPVKDHATLLRALARRSEPLRLAIAGRGEEEARLRALACELGIADRVHLLGLRDDVDQVLAAGDVFVQPSLSEGLPLAILEAMGAGLPIVATSVGGVPEALGAGEAGILVPPGDPEALGAAIAELVESSDAAAKLGIAAHARARAVFSVETMCQRYRELYAA